MGPHCCRRVPFDPSFTAETLRLYQRYQVEVVERYNLCPWAKSARTSANAVPLVFEYATTPLLNALDEAIRLEVDIALLIFPDYQGSHTAFEQVVAELIRQDSKRCELSSPVYAMAAFHPEASIRTSQASDLIPYLRSTPDPTIQLVRLSALERARKNEPVGTQFVDPSQLDLTALLEQIRATSNACKKPTEAPSLRERIAKANLETWQREGQALQQTIETILADRKRVHERFGLAPSPWERTKAAPGTHPEQE